MAQVNVPLEVQDKIWRHTFKTATLLDSLTAVTVGGKTATWFVLWAGKNPKFAGHLRTWEEAGSIKTRVCSVDCSRNPVLRHHERVR
jgi:hypothetical protein